MKAISISIYFILFLFVSCEEGRNDEDKVDQILTNIEATLYEFPPEWAPQEAVWTDFATDNSFIPSYNSRLKIIETLSQYVKTKVVFDNDSLKQVALEYLKINNAKLDSIEFINTSYPMNWIRDPGPIFLSNGKKLKIADFKWSCYGYAYNYDCNTDLRGQVDNELAKDMGLEVEPTGIYLEGGGIEVSNNTVIAYKAMATQRNPDKTLEEVESIILNSLGKEQMIWLDQFPLIDKPGLKTANFLGNGANGHIDVTTRFLNDSTILATVISEEDKNKSVLLAEDYKIFQDNLRQLQAAKQPNGKPYKIITINAPDYSLFEWRGKLTENTKKIYGLESLIEGDSIVFVPALEYANFLITNNAILVSKYWNEGMPESEKIKDEQMITLLRDYFPERDIIALDVLPINWGGGGIHCRTQQQPKIY